MQAIIEANETTNVLIISS